MPELTCPDPDCDWKYSCEFTNDASCIEMIKLHVTMKHNESTAGKRKPPKMDRPTIDIGIDQERWNMFKVRWKQFSKEVEITRGSASLQLFLCASEPLGDLLLRHDSRITDRPIEEVLSAMETFAVIRKPRGIQRAELMNMKQGSDELVETFAARVKSKAETCDYAIEGKCSSCQANISLDYTQDAVKDVIMAGIADVDIQASVMEMDGIEHKPVNEIISLIDRKERTRKAYRPTSVSSLSSMRKQTRNNPQRKSGKTTEQTKKISCPDCKRWFSPFNGKNAVPYKNCFNCYKSSRQQKKASTSNVSANTGDQSQSDALSQHSTILGHNVVMGVNREHRAHPKVSLQLRPAFRGNFVTIEAIADTGAQSNLMGYKAFQQAGFNRSSLQNASIKLSAANKNAIDIIGGFKAQFRGVSPSGETVSCIGMIYVSESVSEFFLSYSTMIDLSIVDENFPIIGRCTTNEVGHGSNDKVGQTLLIRTVNSGCMKNDEEVCDCPQRSAVPQKPKQLPFSPIPSNNDRMKQWLLDRYASSTFNTCPHRPLQEMDGPPVEIHMDEEDLDKLKVCHKPAPVALHWLQRVKDDVYRDIALGLVEEVPYGEPARCCHRMVVTRKHDGSPRRTIDYSPLNKFCKRETFYSESPFQLARRIPPETWKTVTDAWNGYHSVPLRKSDRHLTTFIAPFGRFRYTRTPQGFLSSGDSYNRRFNAILSGFPNKERCVDDTVHYDVNLEQHWWRTIEFLSLVGSSGVVLNPDKFQFAQKSVDFAGFRVSPHNIEPLPKYLDAIRAFPTPKNITDIRSWFGLVNQVSHYAQLRDVMAPFRLLLSPKKKFLWNDEIDASFNSSKQIIVDKIREGVKIFSLDKVTCLRPDWSKKGIGYFLLQKHCSCQEVLPSCCPSGWKVTLAGSRFLSGAEERYAAIEGEALAIAWGLEQTRYFTMGCKDLIIVTDHKPLLRIFNDRTLDEIPNMRLFRIKQRTLPWDFVVKYMPGKTNTAADAASRNPTSCAEVSSFSSPRILSLQDATEESFVTELMSNMEDIASISWRVVVDATETDPTLSVLLTAIEEGFKGEYDICNSYLRYKESLYIQEGAVMFNDRVVVPESLRGKILENLHSAHQGVSTMLLRAQAIMYWPGMSNDIHDVRATCQQCNRNAPSQAPIPIQPASIPLTPFEQVFADFFHFSGHNYLVIGDRLSGWSEVFSTPSGTTSAGARGLITCLRRMFATFGVPNQLSSDGGPEFKASLTKEFLSTWDVEHRVSSAYNAESNGRAEVAVKSTKRLLMSNVDGRGLDNDRFLRAMLTQRNTPDPDCQLSPSQILFGHPLRDALSFSKNLKKYSRVSKRWKEAWRSKEDALRTRYIRNSEDMGSRRALHPLKMGDRCHVQNQRGNYPKRWHSSGVIMETLPFDKYVVRIDGSRKLTTRNRRFLRLYKPISTSIEYKNQCGDIPTSSKPIERVVQRDYEDGAGSSTHSAGDKMSRNEVRTRTHKVVDCEPGGRSTVTPEEVPGGSVTESEMLPKSIPLALRRLRNHNTDGAKQYMINPAGRRRGKEDV